MEWDFEQASASLWRVAQALPEGFRPSRSTYHSGVATDANGNPVDKVSYCWVGYDGRVMFSIPTGSYGNRNCGAAVWAAA